MSIQILIKGAAKRRRVKTDATPAAVSLRDYTADGGDIHTKGMVK